MGLQGLDRSDGGYGPMKGCCYHGNELYLAASQKGLNSMELAIILNTLCPLCELSLQ
jgi:hypothetical protein